jgi:tRNA (cmo5U34)-methyltransferase
MSTSVNRWAEPEWALRYLGERDAIPHRTEGLGVLVELVEPRPTRRILDLGTGDGNTLALMLSVHPDATGVGADFQPAMLERARERFADDERVEVIQHDLDAPLPASLGRFDLVVSSFAIHHLVPSRQRALYGEVYELLESGGRFANLEHVDSPTAALHLDFLAACNRTPDQDDPSNKLVPLKSHLEWLDELGYHNADCFWKWRELALVSGTK